MLPVLRFVLLPSVLVLASASHFPALASSNETDLDALLALKAGLSHHLDALDSWNTTTNFCQWHGVICSLNHGQRVSELNLSSVGLRGYIAPSLGNLSNLRSLDLSYNLFHGEIPRTIGQLSQLSYLDLRNNSIQGEIPWTIGQLRKLSNLYLSNNSIEGGITYGLRNCTCLVSIKLDLNNLHQEIPDWLGDLSKIEIMSLGKNKFTGLIPPSLGNLSSLRILNINDNQLSGSIPGSLGRISKLEMLALHVNHLSGITPRTVFNISSLIHISLQKNELSGTLPTDLGNGLPKIKYLILALNHFTGKVPASIANATTIQSIDLSENNLTGFVPPEIGTLCPYFLILKGNQLKSSTAQDWGFITSLTNCTSVQGVILRYNRFSGVLPSSIANLSRQLEFFDISFNEIYGKIPVGIGNFPNLIKLGLSSNRFTGVIPDNIGKLKMLQWLTLDNNRISGMMPSSLGNLTQLEHLSVANNVLQGYLPANLGNLQRLVYANFSNNALSGPLPREIFSLSSLSYILDLSGNRFSSYLPSEVGGLTKLTYLYIHENNLSGTLPDALSNCESLMELRLDGNYFNGIIPISISKMRGLALLNLTKNALTGAIPQEIGLMNGLKELYLAHNNLSAQIPETLESMTSLYQLDLSFNLLDGQVPARGVFANSTGFLFDGNDKLCGGISELGLPSCPIKQVMHNQRITRVVRNAVISGASIILLLCLILALVVFSLKGKLSLPSARTAPLAPPFMDDMYPRVSYSDLAQATDGFAANNIVGTGQYGCVYKGRMLLKESMITVAVKVFDPEQSGSSKSFVAECKALSKIRHRNLIGIRTCCSDLNQNDFKAIVFDYMPHGNLGKWLHQDTCAPNPIRVLTLMQRLGIATDIAAALDYLHNNCQPAIVHCDLKPSNILLGEGLVTHIGDFGLAKILTDPEGEQLINSKSSLVGTIGYVAPEYGEGGQISPCGDVYSFGIVLLEMFTAKAPTDAMFTGGFTLLEYAKIAYPTQLMEIIDPLLLSVESTLGDINTIMYFVTRLALGCSRKKPAERLSIGDVIAEMNKIKALPCCRIN
uniref:non-specific serine/threonine protein kinase n=1 Tax=Hordeum vulgare subsp. vulgare TaxID=112509 RepID=A0A8I6Z489_HORVV